MPEGIHHLITPVDGAILAGVVVLLTLLALLLRSRTGSVEHFWRPDRLPWPAVALSLARSEFGALVWIAVPGLILTREGDLSYLSWAAGVLIARWMVNLWFVDSLYAGRDAGPLALLESRLGPAIGTLAKALAVLLVISSSVVVGTLSLAPLAAILPVSPALLLAAVLVLACLWGMAGGVRAVVWSDVAVVLLVVGALVGLLAHPGSPFRGDPTNALADLRAAESFDGSYVNKLRIFDLAGDTGWRFTFWCAIFAVPFAQMVSLGLDPRQTTRWLACGTARAAKRAIGASVMGQLLVLGFLATGCLLFLGYRVDPPSDPMILRILEWKAGLPARGDLALPVWILTETQSPWRGLLLAVPLLLALTSITPALLAFAAVLPGAGSLRQIRLRVGLAAFLLLGLGIAGDAWIRREASIDPVATTLAAFEWFGGPLLGLGICALSKRRPSRFGMALGVGISLLVTVWMKVDATGFGAEMVTAVEPFSFFLWPLGTLVTVLLGITCSPRSEREI